MNIGFSVASAINLALVVLCLGVLVQSVRLDRRIRALRDNNLGEAVFRLDRATQQARLVLDDLRFVLANDVTARSEGAAAAEAMRDELAMMVDIGNSVAERISEAASQAQAAEVAARTRATRAGLEAQAERAGEDLAPAPAPTLAPAPALASARTTELSSRVFDILSAHVPRDTSRGSAVA
ncbi:hypothetical protein [Novosphingobium sp. BL-52-GroH]|uniref:hypothetical protein n=1 Tax=Novosphingobium sp. BL-52-GroH TaxID=3349877 RepID=UPI00384B8B69